MTALPSEAHQPSRPEPPQTAFRWRLWPRFDARGRQNATLLALLLILQFAGIVVAPLGVMGAGSFVAMAAVGSCLAPPTLLAFWTVFGSGRLTMRLPLSTWLVAALYVTILFAATRENGGFSVHTFLRLGAWPLAFVYVQLPLWVIRALRRWRFVPASGGETPANQFTLRGLLGWTLAAAVPLAAFRAMMPAMSFDAETLFEMLPFVVFGGLFVALAGLPIVPLAWIFLATGRRPVLRLVLSMLLLSGLPGGVWLFADRFVGGPDFYEIIQVLAGTIANGVIGLMVMGACGYRLDRPHRPLAGEAGRHFGASVAVRRPLSRFRFSFALAPLIGLAAAILCVVPYQLRHWRQAAIATEWAHRGVVMGFAKTDGLLQVEGVNLDHVSDELLRRVADLNGLKSLNLEAAKIDDRQLGLLTPLTNLRILKLSDCEITDAGLDQLAHFKNLEILHLTNTRVTDAGLVKLKALPKLVALNLQLTDVTDAGMVVLAELPRLNWLHVELTAVTGAGVKRFTRRNVMVSHGASNKLLAQCLTGRHTVASMNDGGMNQLILGYPRPLKRLHAQGEHTMYGPGITVTDAGLRSLARHTDLEYLDLHDTAITDQGLRLLSKLSALKTLDLRGTKVTERGIAALSRSLPNCRITR